jgi:hypothetical protein
MERAYSIRHSSRVECYAFGLDVFHTFSTMSVDIPLSVVRDFASLEWCGRSGTTQNRLYTVPRQLARYLLVIFIGSKQGFRICLQNQLALMAYKSCFYVISLYTTVLQIDS